MSLLGNFFWIVLGGWILALEYIAAGLILCITIIGIPFGIQCFKMSLLALFPFGKQIKNNNENTVSLIFNVLWVLFFGVWIALSHLLLAILQAITIIGIPFALQNLKLSQVSIFPFGKSWE